MLAMLAQPGLIVIASKQHCVKLNEQRVKHALVESIVQIICTMPSSGV